MPVRFTSPSLGGQGETYLRPHGWELGVAYRHLLANNWYVGSEIHNDAGPNGEPVDIQVNSVDLTLGYGITSRLSLALSVPLSDGTQNRLYADLQHHEVKAGGVGDINLIGTYWLRDPTLAPSGNVALGLGVKTPSGNHSSTGPFFDKTGQVADQALDQSVQLGDGGWAMIAQAQALQRVASRAYVYLFASYLLSTRVQTGVASPYPGVTGAVPDVYQARLGLAYAVLPGSGVTVSLGGRIDGTPLRDIIGGGDLAFRRPAWILYADPGVALTRGSNNFTLSIPINVRSDFRQSLVDRQLGKRGGGDLAKYLVLAGYTRRF